MVKRLRRRPLTAESGVRFPMRVPNFLKSKSLLIELDFCFFVLRGIELSVKKNNAVSLFFSAGVKAQIHQRLSSAERFPMRVPNFLKSKSLLIELDFCFFVLRGIELSVKKNNAVSLFFSAGVKAQIHQRLSSAERFPMRVPNFLKSKSLLFFFCFWRG